MLVALIILDSAVETVARARKLMKMRDIFEKFFVAALTRTVIKIFQKYHADSDDYVLAVGFNCRI